MALLCLPAGNVVSQQQVCDSFPVFTACNPVMCTLCRESAGVIETLWSNAHIMCKDRVVDTIFTAMEMPSEV